VDHEKKGPAAVNLPSTDARSRFAADVLQPLRRMRRALRTHVIVAGLAWWGAAFAALVISHFALDRLLVLGAGPRVALLLALMGTAAYLFAARVLRPAAVPLALPDLAAVVERAHPSLDDRLVSAVAFSTVPPVDARQSSPDMVRAVMDEARLRFREVRPADLLDRRFYRAHLALLMLAAGVFAAAGAASPELVAIYIARGWLLRDTPWPSRTRLYVEGMTHRRLRWPIGDELTLVARVEGDLPPALRAEIRFDTGQGSTRDALLRGSDQFLVELGPVERSMDLRFLISRWGADEHTDWYRIDAVARPSVRQLRARVTPPAYTRLPAFDVAAGQGTADVLRGSAVRLEAELARPVARAVLRTAAQTLSEARPGGEGRIVADFVPPTSGSYYFDLQDADGLTDLRPMSLRLRVVNDPAPRVRLSLPGAGEMMVPTALLPIAVDCEDNLALRRVNLYVEARREAAGAAAPPVEQSLPGFSPPQARFKVDTRREFSGLGLQPGDRLSLLVRAADYQEAIASSSRPVAASAPAPAGVADSTTYTLRVVTAEELLNDLTRRESEWRREFELVLKSQEQIRGRVIELHQAFAAPERTADLPARYAAEVRAQRSQVNRLQTVRRQFEQILSELRINHLAEPAVRQRLEGGILGPLARLISSDCPQAAALMDKTSARYEVDTAEQVEDAQTRLVQSMHAILAGMLKWEGYNEAVALLRDIVRLQEDLNRQTRARLDQQIDRLLQAPSTLPSTQPVAPP
jgi:hypothetical protein